MAPILGGRSGIQVNAKRDDLWQPSEFRAGPSVLRAATEWGLDEAKRANNGVDLVVERELHHPVENFDPYSTGALLIVVGCPLGLALGVLVSRRLALLAPLAAFVGIWLMYHLAGFPFMRLLIAMLGVGCAVAGLMVGLSGLI